MLEFIRRAVPHLFAPVDIASLALFRIVFGVVLAGHFVNDIFTGLVRLHYVIPSVYFTYPGFSWVKPLPGEGMVVLYWVLAALALMVALGLYYRLAAALLFVGFTYVFLIDLARFQNHLYLTSLLCFLLIFTPAHRALSLDARRHPAWRSETIPAWAVWLLRFQLGVVYFFGGIAKCNADWMFRGEPMGLWLKHGGAEGGLRLGFFDEPWAGYFFSWGGLLLDLLIVPALLFKPTRAWAYLISVAFHLTNVRLFNIGFFPWMMIFTTLIFFAPDWPRRARLLGPMRGGGKGKRKKGAKKTGPDERASGTLSPRRRLGLAVAGVYVVAQLLVPLRHYLYPGNVSWTSEGIYFAWHMKLRDMQGKVELYALDPGTKKATRLDPEGLLTERQLRAMIHDAGMIHQFVRKVGEQLHKRGQRNVDIRVRSMLSLNGRPPQPLIDPEVNLTAEPPSLGHKAWIVPLAPLPL